MVDVAATRARRSVPAFNASAWLVFGLSVVLVFVAVLIPSSALAWLRGDFPFFAQATYWLQHIVPQVDLIHVLLFAWLALLSSALWRRLRWWQVAVMLAALAGATELLQFLVPGREPRVSDIYDDLNGVAIGLGMAMPLRWRR